MSMPPFHLAFPVTNLAAIREFYCSVLKCDIGRESERWIDFNFFGHQITAHLDETDDAQPKRNKVDNKAVPARHFGVILEWNNWDELLKHINTCDITFYIEPYTRFAGEEGEQRTFFIQDPSENFLEFKCFQDNSTIFNAE
jgi:extradiol dioxygenase family protein